MSSTTADPVEPARPVVCVCADPAADLVLRDAADDIGRRLALPVVHYPQIRCDGLLVVTPDGLELRWQSPTIDVPGEAKRSAPIRVDFSQLDISSGAGRSRKQPIAKAVGVDRSDETLHVIDATGGYGEDAWILAALGCRVTLCERNPIVALLLSDGLTRAASTMPDIRNRITLQQTDARAFLAALDAEQQPDVVYLDPMFPPRTGSALERKALRVLRLIVGGDPDAAALFDAARHAARRRVVVKRPSDAPPIDHSGPPVTAHHGKGFRFDVYPVT